MKYLSNLYNLWVYWPALKPGNKSPLFSNGLFSRTSIPSPPPVFSLLTWAVDHNCATWYSSTVIGNSTRLNIKIKQLKWLQDAPNFNEDTYNSLINILTRLNIYELHRFKIEIYLFCLFIKCETLVCSIALFSWYFCLFLF